MSLEIEVKFAVESFSPIESALGEQGVVFAEAVRQIDQYLAHPQRDFGETDEALRVRRVDGGCQLTYKGPKLDDTSKTRCEIELAIRVEEADQAQQLLLELGFRPVAVVQKLRRSATVTWNALPITVALDEVAGLGLFVELEVVTDTSEFQSIRQELFRFAESLGLGGTERRSYLELLLDS